MNEQLILVADSDPKNLQILKENLESAGFRVETVTNGIRAWEFIINTPPNIVLSEVTLPEVSGLELLERIQSDERTRKVPLIFLTNKRELQDRIHSLKMGAKDYLVKPLHVKEVIAHIKMVLARLDRKTAKETNSYFKLVGRLEELSIFDLIESFGVERKTGVLNITNKKNQTGQIFFKDGCVINATQGDFRKEKAVFQMLPWSSGDFSMVFKEVGVPDEIAVSNLGLLLQGLKRMEQREKYIQQLPGANVKFLPTSTFQSLLTKKKLSKEVVNFVSLFDGNRDINAIIENSTYEEIRTLDLTIRLFKQGFIKPSSPQMRVTRRPSPELLDVEPDIQPPIFEEKRPPKIAKPAPKAAPIPAPKPIRSQPIQAPKPERPPKAAVPEYRQVARKIEPQQPAPKPVAPKREIPPEPKPAAYKVNAVPEIKPEELNQEMETPIRNKIVLPKEDGKLKPMAMPKPPKPPAGEYPPAELESEIIKTVVFKKKPVEKKIPEIIEPVSLKEPQTDLFIFIGDSEIPKQSVFQALVENDFKKRNFNGIGIGEIKISSIKVSDNYAVNLVSIPLDGKFNVLLDNYADKLSAYSLVVDCLQPDQWEYFGYVARMLHERHIRPFSVIATNMTNSDIPSMEVLRDRLNLSQNIPVHICEPINKANIKNILIASIPNWPRERSHNISKKDFASYELES